MNVREANDPLLHTAGILYRAGWMSLQAIVDFIRIIKHLIEAKAVEAIREPRMDSAEAIMASLFPKQQKKQLILLPDEARRVKSFCQCLSVNWHKNVIYVSTLILH